MATPKHRKNQPARPRTLEARYCNYFEIGHNAFEFIFDFGQYHPEDSAAHMHSRIVTGPVYAKLLAGLLQDTLKRFEDEHGTIRAVDDEMDPIELVKQSIAGFDHRLRSLGQSRESDSVTARSARAGSGSEGDCDA